MNKVNIYFLKKRYGYGEQFHAIHLDIHIAYKGC